MTLLITKAQFHRTQSLIVHPPECSPQSPAATFMVPRTEPQDHRGVNSTGPIGNYTVPVAVVEPQSPSERSDQSTATSSGQQAGPVERLFAARPWWHRTCSPEDRRRVMDDLAIRPVEHWIYRFGVMLTLSVIVAVAGLELNSAAVVIGAMLLAPLMQPVLATGACLSMALFVKALGAFTKVVVATAWCIGLSFLIARLLPEQQFTSEVLSRTAPDIRDLVVALAAGTAGAYATVREDVSSSLPGVAVAVALVPPLGAAGISLEAGDQAKAFGALLLYTTNLAAIIFASIVVFVVTGFVPPRRLASTLPRLALSAVVTAGIVIAIAGPLYDASVSTIEARNNQTEIETVVDTWLGDADLVRTVRVADGLVSVELRGFQSPPDQTELEMMLAERFPDLAGPPIVQWIRTERATTTTSAPPDPNLQLQQAIEAEVNSWLSELGFDYQLDRVSVNEGIVRIDAAGAGDISSDDLVQLSERLNALAEGLRPRLNWSFRETIEIGGEEVSPLELVTESIGAELRTWAEDIGLEVDDFRYDGDRLEVELIGQQQPSTFQMRRLEQTLLNYDDDGFDLALFFTQRVPVTTTVPEPAEADRE